MVRLDAERMDYNNDRELVERYFVAVLLLEREVGRHRSGYHKYYSYVLAINPRAELANSLA